MVKLTSFNLSSTCLSAKSCSVLATCSSLGNLEELFLHDNNISLEGMSAIINSKQLSKLRKLSITPPSYLFSNQNITPNPNSNIETIILSGCTFGVELLDMIDIKALTHLDLSKTSLTDEHLHLLSSCYHLQNLKILDLGYNNLSDRGIIDFANYSLQFNLETISIRHNLIIYSDSILLTLQSKMPSLKNIFL